jgi:formylmethanofuran--tetrahydromethanopterin N-formyltransferase
MEIENTYCEAFDGLFSRIIITAKNQKYLRKAALGSTCLPSTVIGRTEGGVEKWLSAEETPDGRIGAIIQVWANYGKDVLDKFEYEYSIRIRQGILVVPTTRVFNALDSPEKMDMMRRVGHCGDGYEEEVELFDRKLISIPIMMGDFLIERFLGYSVGVMGGNLWFFCESEDSALEAGERAVDAVAKVEGAITSFDICAAGSKVETKFPEIGPTTNHPYCPSLKNKIPESKVPEGVTSIPEIVINGINLETIKKAMKAAIESVKDVEGLLRISAGNYGGKLGKYKIWLKDL